MSCLQLAKAIKLSHSTQIDVNLACEDGNSKLVEVVTVVDDDKHVGNSLLQICKLKFAHKV